MTFQFSTKAERPDLLQILNEETTKIKQTVGEDETVVLALSGGVDSLVAAIIIYMAIGNRLKCVFVDQGGMRLGEVDEVVALGKHFFGDNFIAVDAADEYLAALHGVSDFEMQRKIIGKKFVEIFARVSKQFNNVKWFGQGTIKTDLSESGKGGQKFIKSHHNVGFDEFIKAQGWTLIEPLKRLMKSEGRIIGNWLDIPQHHLLRQPFPGPGNLLRLVKKEATYEDWLKSDLSVDDWLESVSITKKDLADVAKVDAVVRKNIDSLELPDAKQYYGAVFPKVEFGMKDVILYDQYKTQAFDILRQRIRGGALLGMHDYIKIANDIRPTAIRNGERAQDPVMCISNFLIYDFVKKLYDVKSGDFSKCLFEIQCDVTDKICQTLPIGRVWWNLDYSMPSGLPAYVMRAVNTLNYDDAVPTYVDFRAQQNIKSDIDEIMMRRNNFFVDLTKKGILGPGTIEYK